MFQRIIEDKIDVKPRKFVSRVWMSQGALGERGGYCQNSPTDSSSEFQGQSAILDNIERPNTKWVFLKLTNLV